MKVEFREAYTALFQKSFSNLRRIIRVRYKAICYFNKHIQGDLRKSKIEKDKGNIFRKYKTLKDVSDEKLKMMNFEPIDQRELFYCDSDLQTTSEEEDSDKVKNEDGDSSQKFSGSSDEEHDPHKNEQDQKTDKSNLASSGNKRKEKS